MNRRERGHSRIVVVLLIVAATALAVWLRRRDIDPQPVIEAGASAVPPAEVSRAILHTEEKLDAKISGTATVAAPGETPNDSEIEFFVRREAQELDDVHVDQVEKRRQIREVVKKITPQQSRRLLDTVKNPKATSGEKIISTFLLVEGGLKTQKELTELITAPLVENQDYAPHSAEEMRGIREKSLRIMAVDGLFSRAKTEPGARAELARAASESADPTIRAYAQDKIRQLR